MMTQEHLIQKIESILETIRPNIQMDGGDIKLIKFEDGVVYIKFQGACVGCPASAYTLKMGIEEALKAQMSDVHEVVSID